jgi:nucleotide-binding universal stress UspA family protein
VQLRQTQGGAFCAIFRVPSPAVLRYNLTNYLSIPINKEQPMESQGRYKKVVVPLDGSGWSQRAVPHAVDIARANSSELILLHIFVPPASEYTDQLALSGQDGQIQQMREAMKHYLIGVRSELRSEDIKVRTQVIEGMSVPSLICDYINDEGIDLVVMSTRGRTGISRFLFGSVASKVMECAQVPVLLIQPDKDEGV